jgi:outer membrane protein
MYYPKNRNKTMKKSISILFFGLLVGLSSTWAQSKIGYVEYEKILSLMPQIDTVKAKLEKKQAEYQANIDAMKKEMQDIEVSIQSNPNMDPVIKEAKYRKYESLGQEMQNFAMQAEQQIQSKELELMKPVYNKLDAAIKEVAIAKSLDFVLTDGNAGGYVVVYYKNESDNITKAVMDKLGIKESTTTGGGATGTVKAQDSMMVRPK